MKSRRQNVTFKQIGTCISGLPTLLSVNIIIFVKYSFIQTYLMLFSYISALHFIFINKLKFVYTEAARLSKLVAFKIQLYKDAL